jgi:hypothetical protein
MMVDAFLLEWERDVEQSRARLTRDLAVLCSPETFASFTDDLKQEAFETKDALWDDVKARAAANPAAVIAIGAGLAWRLVQRPPIATALIGLGVYSLWNTEPKQPGDAKQAGAQGRPVRPSPPPPELLVRRRKLSPQRVPKSGMTPEKKCGSGAKKCYSAR